MRNKKFPSPNILLVLNYPLGVNKVAIIISRAHKYLMLVLLLSIKRWSMSMTRVWLVLLVI